MNAPKILSLSRFYHSQKKMPAWVAGRFFNKSTAHFFLKSQAQSLLCEKKNMAVDIKEGAWLAVELLSQKKKTYQIGKYFVLSAPRSSFIEKDFSFQKKGKILQEWRRFLNAVSDFFIKEGLAYSSTPHLVKCPGTEPHLQVLKTSFKENYLATSPEMHLKRLLCQDWTDFFEIKTCYREEEISPHHQVEFTLLEWYRAFYSSRELMEECYKLLLFLQDGGFCKVLPYKVFTVAQLFKKYLDFSLTPKSSKQDLAGLVEKYELNDLSYSENRQALTESSSHTNEQARINCQLHTDKQHYIGSYSRERGNLQQTSFEDLFFLLFLNKIEPQLSKKNPVFICDYPPQLRGFAQINQRGWADRFELYWQGLELANAFYEVIDPLEQKKLFQLHLKQRKKDLPLDAELLKEMEMGMPPVSGIALGLDRLFLALLKQQDLRQIRLFPL